MRVSEVSHLGVTLNNNLILGRHVKLLVQQI